MLNLAAAVTSLLVLILACIGCAFPKMWRAEYAKNTAASPCWSVTGVTTYKGPPVTYGSSADFLESATCDSETDETVGIWKSCTKKPALVPGSCRWSADKPYATAAQKNKNPGSNKWLIASDKKSGLFPGCSYKKPDDWTCTTISEANDAIQAQKAMAEKAGGAVLEAWTKANDMLSNFKATQGLYVTAIVLHGIGFFVLLATVAFASKNLLLAAAGLHALGGLFFMIAGAVMTAKFNDSRKNYKNWEGTKLEDMAGKWDVTFAAAWTCWLFGWVCAALAAVQSTKVGGSSEGKTEGEV